jgi:hypothetical protein
MHSIDLDCKKTEGQCTPWQQAAATASPNGRLSGSDRESRICTRAPTTSASGACSRGTFASQNPSHTNLHASCATLWSNRAEMSPGNRKEISAKYLFKNHFIASFNE